MVKRFQIWRVNLQPTLGSEQQGDARPALVISPDELNEHLNTVIIAPITTQLKGYPFRVPIVHKKKKCEVMLEQVRTISKQRLVKSFGELAKPYRPMVLDRLQEMFAE
jgi:mRNA interferase MazF